MASRFKLDENLPSDALALFRDAGHDVESALEERLGGQPDPAVFAACQREGRILVTLDLDSPTYGSIHRVRTRAFGFYGHRRRASLTF